MQGAKSLAIFMGEYLESGREVARLVAAEGTAARDGVKRTAPSFLSTTRPAVKWFRTIVRWRGGRRGRIAPIAGGRSLS